MNLIKKMEKLDGLIRVRFLEKVVISLLTISFPHRSMPR